MNSETRQQRWKTQLKVLKAELILRKKYANQAAIVRDRVQRQINELEMKIERSANKSVA